MQSDNYILGHEALSHAKKEIHRQFGDEMVLEEEKSAWEHHGWFILRYQYIPEPYMIHFEGEFNSFNIRITKEDGAYIALKQLIDYNNNFTERNLCDSIEKLKDVLKTEIAFYKIIDGKRYQEINGVYKRIKR